MPNAFEYGLIVGATYPARKGARSAERTILWISADGEKVQYDSDAVANGRRYPTVIADVFAKWAGITPPAAEPPARSGEETEG